MHELADRQHQRAALREFLQVAYLAAACREQEITCCLHLFFSSPFHPASSPVATWIAARKDQAMSGAGAL